MNFEVENLVVGRGPVGVVTCLELLHKGQKVFNIDIGRDLSSLSQKFTVESNINYTGVLKLPSIVKDSNSHLWGGACMGWRFFENESTNDSQLPGLPIDKTKFKAACNRLVSLLNLTRFDFIKDKPKFGHLFKIPESLELIFAKIVRDPYLTKQINELESNLEYRFKDGMVVNDVKDLGSILEINGVMAGTDVDFTIKAKRVFLAGGTLNNTRILLDSDLDIPAFHLLGKNLSDHISLPLTQIPSDDILKVERLFGYKKAPRKTKLWPRIRLRNNVKFHSILDSFCYVTDIEAISKLGNKLHMICRYIPYARHFLRIKVKGNFQLNLFAEILNTPKNAIELNMNQKKLQINFNLTEADRAEISKIVTGYFEGLRELFETNLPDPTQGSSRLSELHLVQSGSHPSGTYRMSVSPNEGIINPNSELHKHRNIFVLGAGGFPRSAATHPTFTAMALAVLSVNSIPWKNTPNILGNKWEM